MHRLLARYVPGFASFRCPGRWLLLTALVVALLGAFGVDAVAGPKGDAKHRVGKLVMIGLLAAVAIGLLAVELRRLTSWTTLAPAMALLAAAVLMAAAEFRPGRAAALAALLLPVALFELAAFATSILETLPPETFPRENPLVRALQTRLGDSRVFTQKPLMTDGEAFWHRLHKFQGYEPIPLDRTIRYVRVAISRDYPLQSLEGCDEPNLREAPRVALLDPWAVRYIATRDEDELPAGSSVYQRVEQFKLPGPTTFRDHETVSFDCQLWENPHAMPRGFVVGSAREASGSDQDSALSTLDPRREVLLERDVLPPGPRQPFTPARFIEDTPNRVTLEVQTTLPGYLVLADSFYPGWTATLEKRRLEILPADVAFRAVALPEPGTHRVVFRYFPPGLSLSLATSTTTAIVLFLLYIRGAASCVRSE